MQAKRLARVLDKEKGSCRGRKWGVSTYHFATGEYGLPPAAFSKRPCGKDQKENLILDFGMPAFSTDIYKNRGSSLPLKPWATGTRTRSMPSSWLFALPDRSLSCGSLEGWVNGYPIANIKSPGANPMARIRRRLGMVRIKQWKTYKGTRKELQRRAMAHTEVKIDKRRRNDYNENIINVLMPNRHVDELG